MLQGRWWKKSVLATSSVVIIFYFSVTFGPWLQSPLSLSSLNPETSQLPDSQFPSPVPHPFLIYSLTCLFTDHWLSFQIKKSPHSQCFHWWAPAKPTSVTLGQRDQGLLTPLRNNLLVNKNVPATGKSAVVTAYKSPLPHIYTTL